MTVSSRNELLGLDPAEFVAARDALARQHKADGQRDEAAAVKAMRRPTVPIWALNRAARDDGDAIETLLATAAEARDAQEALLSGDVDRDALREALAQRRAAMHDVVHRASEIIEGSGRSASAQQREVESLLNTIVASEDLSERLRAGELIDATDDQADDDLSGLLGASVPKTAAKSSTTRPVSSLSDARAAKQAAAARKELEQAEKAESAAADAVANARQSVTDADEALEGARAALARAEAAAGGAHEVERTAMQAHEESIAVRERAEKAVVDS